MNNFKMDKKKIVWRISREEVFLSLILAPWRVNCRPLDQADLWLYHDDRRNSDYGRAFSCK